MPTNSDSPDDQFDATIQQGRAAVRLIEAINVLLRDAAEPEASELRALQRYRRHFALSHTKTPVRCVLARDAFQDCSSTVSR